MKLALDAWYEAWGRTGNGDAVAPVKHGEATSSTEADARNRARRDRQGLERVGDVDPPLVGAGP